MQIFGKDRVINCFSPDHPFAYEMDDGETVWIEMDDCYGGVFQTEQDLRTPEVDTSCFDAAVGPILVQGAEAGDVLCVRVLDIQLAEQGVMVTAKGLGMLGDQIDAPNTKIIPIREGYAYFSPSIMLPLAPMIGVMGVLPREGRYPCTVPGTFGGNMDTKELGVGAKLYLPVFHHGAGLVVADLHACMGDGEMSGTGIEIAGRVCIQVSVMKGACLAEPVLETDEAVYTIATAATYEQAARTAAQNMAVLLQERLSLCFQDAYRLLSAVCDLRISQVVNGVYTMKVRVPKAVLSGRKNSQ